jgi:hypothetical protein
MAWAEAKVRELALELGLDWAMGLGRDARAPY